MVEEPDDVGEVDSAVPVDVVVQPVPNRGRMWIPEEETAFRDAYARLQVGGLGKGEVVTRLCDEFGRGRFAIEKRLKGRG